MHGTKNIRLAKLQEIFNILDSGEHLERVGRALRFKPEYKERILRIWEDTPSTPSTPSIQDHL